MTNKVKLHSKNRLEKRNHDNIDYYFKRKMEDQVKFDKK